MGVLYHFSTNIEADIDNAFGSFEAIVGYNDFMEISLTNLSGLFLIFILSFPMMNYFVKGFSVTTAYIFTRIKSKTRFILSKQAVLAFYCFISSATYFAVKLSLGSYGLKPANIFICFVVFWLFFTVFCSSVCTFSLLFGTVKAYMILLIVNSALCLSVTIYYLNYSATTQWLFVFLNPTAHFMLNWGAELSEMVSPDYLSLISPAAGIAYFLIILAILNVISAAAINNRDIGIKFFDEE